MNGNLYISTDSFIYEVMEMMCKRCVMDETDSGIIFDKDRICNHCKKYDELNKIQPGLDKLIEQIKASKVDKYDCLIGISGGVDSSFVIYLAKKYKLNPLCYHLDNGWNDPIGDQNVKSIVEKLHVDLVTEAPSADIFKDLQLSFLKASVPDLEIPTDHVLQAALHEMADKHNIKYIIMGGNIRTESHVPREWSQGYYDWKYIKSIHSKFGTKDIDSLPHTTILKMSQNMIKHKVVNLLNYIDYNKTNAMKILEAEIGWKYYGGKHYESTYTKFYQGVILPQKFGFDKRKSHFSSLICAGEMTREEAIKLLQEPTYDPEQQKKDEKDICDKFGLSEKEFNALLTLPNKKFDDYPNSAWILNSKLYMIYSIALQKISGIF